ncbi:hypothetical protein Tco_1047115, partial [Tanacetum coccineum]
RYQGTSERVEDTEDESSDSDTKSEGLEDEGPGSEEEASVSEQQRVEETPALRPLVRATWVDPVDDIRLDALPPALFEGYYRDLRELYTRSRAVKDEIFSLRYRLRSLEQEEEQERDTVTFGAIWRPMLALES